MEMTAHMIIPKPPIGNWSQAVLLVGIINPEITIH